MKSISKFVLVAWGTLCFLLAIGACGASLNGPATMDNSDPCRGHLNCGWTCCWAANSDGAGFSCNDPGSKNACEYVGMSDDGTGEFKAKPKKDRPKPHDGAPQ